MSVKFNPVPCPKCGEIVRGATWTGCGVSLGYTPPDSMKRSCGQCGYFWYEEPLDKRASEARG